MDLPEYPECHMDHMVQYPNYSQLFQIHRASRSTAPKSTWKSSLSAVPQWSQLQVLAIQTDPR